ncbi:MFS transporter [Ochrobactrum soli]|uniref:Membrane protein n=1 Tax=Ochrobactrum soli TaxID=2448455 RepID=A0A2P9HQH4_9HYPH|nr:MULTISPECIES: MFS transporter [Brucella]RRD24355.1 MFS transporter [Brucellaceae bacterium VT-16-1752]WHT43090.1 MFS transporter [Ochrobactrum sp. SSR]MDX4076610.1 MFS transporter [Brucella sp. NBRC 113783]RLL73529.1 MFS transporter [[Ochrobactrum] soli]WHS32643.1 MFS transporter [Brucella sp. NM4]
MEQVSGREDTAPSRAPMITKERVAVALLFLANGYIFGGWAPKIPEFAARLGLDSAGMGLMILVFGVGSLAMMPVAGALSAQRGSGAVVRIFALAFIPALLIIALVPNVVTAVIVMFYFGGTMAAMDVAMNANAVAVEKSMRRAIMSSCHAFWSLGGLIGAATGGFLITQFGSTVHALVATIAAAIMIAVAWPSIIADKFHHPSGEKQKLTLPRNPLPWLVGVMALFSMVPEGAIIDWSAYHMRQDLGASVTLAGFGFAAFSFSMAVMRFAGDLVRDRFGAVRTLRACTTIAIIGMLIVGFSTDPYVSLVGFAICGIGISNMVPIAFSMAGNMPGVNPSVGLSIATTLGYSGMLVAPSLIGFVAKHSGFGVVFIALPVLLLVVLAFSSLARYADQKH